MKNFLSGLCLLLVFGVLSDAIVAVSIAQQIGRPEILIKEPASSIVLKPGQEQKFRLKVRSTHGAFIEFIRFSATGQPKKPDTDSCNWLICQQLEHSFTYKWSEQENDKNHTVTATIKTDSGVYEEHWMVSVRVNPLAITSITPDMPYTTIALNSYETRQSHRVQVGVPRTFEIEATSEDKIASIEFSSKEPKTWFFGRATRDHSESYTWDTVGKQEVTATITTGKGGRTTFTWKVNVVEPPPPNQPPTTKRREPTIRLNHLEVGGRSHTLDMSNYFADPDSKKLTYNKRLGPNSGAIKLDWWLGPSDSKLLIVKPQKAGIATFTVTASDSEYSVEQAFSVMVKSIEPPPTNLPDLIVESISVSPSTLGPGEDFTISATVRNIGTGRAQSSVLHYYGPDLSQVGSRNIPRLSPNQERKASISLKAPDAPGTYYYDACVKQGRGDEVNKDNNCSTRVAITVGTSVNQVPIVFNAIPARTLTAGSASVVVDISGNFRDPDNDELSYAVHSDDTGVAAVNVSGSQVTLTPKDAGIATITVTASDGELTATQRFSVTVTAAPVANQAPFTVGLIPNQTLPLNANVVRLDLSDYFSDADDDTLTYTTTVDNASIALLQTVKSYLSIYPLQTGRANVRVMASDGNLAATQEFIVLVQQPQREQPTNQPPSAIGTIAPQTLTVSGGAQRVDVSSHFHDSDGDSLTYTARSDDTNVVTVRVSRSQVTITPQSAGSTTLHVTASDGSLSVAQSISITVAADAPLVQDTTSFDLAIQSITVSKNTLSPGESFTLSVTIRNEGPGTSEEAVLSYYHSSIQGRSPTDPPQVQGTVSLDSLASGNRITKVINLSAPSTPRTYYYGAWLSANNGDTNLFNDVATEVDMTVQPPTNLFNDVATEVDMTVQPPKQAQNRAPVASGSIPAQTLTVGAAAGVQMSGYFSDPEADSLTYTARSDATSVATTQVSGDFLTITPVRAGSATITVTASDGSLRATQSISVTVNSVPQPQNRAPVASGSIPAQTLTVGAAAAVQVSGYFSDPDGDNLTYTARSSATSVATGQISGDFLTITPVRAGRATITVTASDGGLTATHRFTATVQAASFGVGDQIIVQNSSGGGLNGLLVRNGAGTGFTHVISVFNGATGTIRSGPRNANGYTWWQVAWDRSDQVFCDVNPCVGWVFEFFQGTRVIAENTAPPVTTPQPLQSPPDLVVESVRVSDDTLAPRESFKFYATVRNQGAGEASRTTLRYYRSSDATISTTDTEVDTDSVISLDPNESDEEWDSLRAPDQAGVYYYGVCVDSVTDESSTNNNCSTGIRVTVEASLPDLVVESVRVSDDTVEVGDRFTFYATVRNQGNGEARRTTLRYYRSSDSNISDADTEEDDTDSVSSLDADETSDERVTLTAPNRSGVYYYGACVDSVTDESNTRNNCSTAIKITVADAIIVRPPPGLGMGDSIVVQNASGGGLNGLIVRAGAGTGFAHIISVFNGATGTITDGPESANGYTWWKVAWDRSDQVFCDVNPCVGWVFEFFRGTRVIAEDGLAAPTLNAIIPTETGLLSNYPNPFNPETWIPYQLSESVDVSVSIYAVDGHLVRRLDLGHQAAGIYQSKSRAAYWDGRNSFGERVASGLYFYTLTAGDFTATRKMLIRK